MNTLIMQFSKIVFCWMYFFIYSMLLNFYDLPLYYSRVSNRRGGRNKWGVWHISVKITNEEGAINGEVGKYLQS